MKKTIKKIMFTGAIAVLLVCSLVFSAFAANYQHVADELFDLGAVQGTDKGFELDRAPYRIEALVMQIRLLGLEEEAINSDYENPFTDVPVWAVKYAAFAYENGLTKGVSETRFDPNAQCTAQMYATFMLRALGYSEDDGDFSFSNALEFALEVGIIDEILTEGTFLRGDMFAVTYLVLFTAPKDGEFDTLLEKLVNGGVYDASKAAVMQEKFKLLNEFMLVGTELEDALSFAMKMYIELEQDWGPYGIELGIEGTMKAAIDMDLSMVITDDFDIEAAIIMSYIMEMMGEEMLMEMEVYIKDGNTYINDGDDKYFVEDDLGIMDLEELLVINELTGFEINPVHFIRDIKKSTEGGFTVYTVDFVEDFFGTLMGMSMDMMDSGIPAMDPGDMTIEIPTMKYYVDTKGELKQVLMTMVMTMNLEIDDSGVKIPVLFIMDMVIEVIAVGDTVVVNFPDDLDEYEDWGLGEGYDPEDYEDNPLGSVYGW